MRLNKIHWLIIAAVSVTVVCLLAFAVWVPTGHPPPSAPQAKSDPPPTRVCGNQSILDSRYTYDGQPGTFNVSGSPSGLPTFGSAGSDFPDYTRIVVISAGNNTMAAVAGRYGADHTIFYFEPGRHVIQDGMVTGDHSIYIGGYDSSGGSAILDGVNGGAPKGVGGSYLSVSSPGVVNADQTWEYLTIENFATSQNNAVMGNEYEAGFDNGNTYKYDTIGPNEYGYAGAGVAPKTGESNGGGYAIGAGGYTTIEYNCLTQNAQGAFNGGGVNDIISHNEIMRNGLGEYPDTEGPGGSPYRCGCSGGGKLLYSVNAVVTNNYVHDNYNIGIWLDFDNTGADISDNYVASNWGEGISYEASYNANISDNTLTGNGWASNGAWPAGVGGRPCYGGVSCVNGYGPITGAGGAFPYAALFLPNSGGNKYLHSVTVPDCKSDCTVESNYSGELLVEGNNFIDNFGAVMVYTDTNRYPGNIDNDSACSTPLGPLGQPNNGTYYLQTKELYTAADATIAGTSVTSTGGTTTLCSNYGASEGDGGQLNAVHAPSAGMAVYNLNTRQLIGTVASVTNAKAFTLKSPAVSASGVSLVLSAYGGCGPADYYGGAPGVKSGQPAAYYWDNCIWGSRNVTVSHNTFSMRPDRVTGCTRANMCGYMAAVAFNAGVPPLMQFFDSYARLIASVSGALGNIWSENTYLWLGSGGPGQWQFWAGTQGNHVTWAQWTAPPYGQDARSTVSGASP